MDDPLAEIPVLNREHDFNTPEQISRQPISAADKYLRLAGVFEIINPAVLKKPIHDAAHGYVLAQPLHTRTQTADAADNQIDLHPRLRRAIKSVDDLRFGQGIDL